MENKFFFYTDKAPKGALITKHIKIRFKNENIS